MVSAAFPVARLRLVMRADPSNVACALDAQFGGEINADIATLHRQSARGACQTGSERAAHGTMTEARARRGETTYT
jgi:hypothetical protein